MHEGRNGRAATEGKRITAEAQRTRRREPRALRAKRRSEPLEISELPLRLCAFAFLPVTVHAALLCGFAGTAEAANAAAPEMPRYAHIFVIIEENHTADEIVGSADAPNITRLAKTYGYASQFYAEGHPSEPNYVAILGGDTFGISDDDAFYCKPGMKDVGCEKSGRPDYVDHTLTAPSLADQLKAHGLTWKGYFEDIPEPGSRAWRWPAPDHPVAGKPAALYAVKHNGFMNFKSVQNDPNLAREMVGFDVLTRDLAAGSVPSYAQIVPDQCDDMHGLKGANVPDDCQKGPALVARGDTALGKIVDSIMASPVWKDKDNSAIVITFDENDDKTASDHPNGCCGFGDAHNPGGGWIPTIVVTNHGPRGRTDATPYNHYSLLRTTEEAFGISDYLGHAADAAQGVNTMAPLFAVSPAK